MRAPQENTFAFHDVQPKRSLPRETLENLANTNGFVGANAEEVRNQLREALEISPRTSAWVISAQGLLTASPLDHAGDLPADVVQEIARAIWALTPESEEVVTEILNDAQAIMASNKGSSSQGKAIGRLTRANEKLTLDFNLYSGTDGDTQLSVSKIGLNRRDFYGPRVGVAVPGLTVAAHLAHINVNAGSLQLGGAKLMTSSGKINGVTCDLLLTRSHIGQWTVGSR